MKTYILLLQNHEIYLKIMHCQAGSMIKMLKPMHIATQKQQKKQDDIQNQTLYGAVVFRRNLMFRSDSEELCGCHRERRLVRSHVRMEFLYLSCCFCFAHARRARPARKA